MFVILWEFEVKPGYEKSFQTVYGPEGAWVQLFRRDLHYHMTRLLLDHFRPLVYFTLDFWDCESAYENFKTANRQAHQARDRETKGLTLAERHIGSFRQHESTA